MEFTFISHSRQDTVRFGRMLGKSLKAGCVAGLIGELGAGKTCFVKGIANGINGIPEREVTSPTYTILQEYNGNVPFYHFDAYRLSSAEDLETVGFEDYLYGDGISVIEWADRVGTALPKECLLVYIEFINENERRFKCKAAGEQYGEILKKFRVELESVCPQ